MLKITVPSVEMFDNKTQTFFSIEEQTLELEHSLVSISKWESKWCKSFISTNNKTAEEILDYIKCMTLNDNVDPNVYKCLTKSNITDIDNYIYAPMTATTFHDERPSGRKPIVTSELIYYWMIASNIPMECQLWHLNRLLTLIRVCSIKSGSSKKMSKKEIANKYASLNAARKQKLNTKG